MVFDPIEHMKEIMGTHGISVLVLEPPYDNIGRFDEQLRQQLYKDYNYNEVLEVIDTVCRDYVIYVEVDQFEVHYIIFKLPRSSENNNRYLVIGPYRIKEYSALLPDVIEKNKLPIIMTSELKEYYRGIPHITFEDALESEVIILAKYIFGSTDFGVDRTGINFSPTEFEPYIKKDSGALSMKMIEERYQNEDGLLAAVERGDMKQAMLHMSANSKFHIETRLPDRLRSYKNYFIVLNSLLRKAVQRADVHPAHIDSTSASFAKDIEAAKCIEDLGKLITEMLRKYCLLVQNHSLRRFSKPIQKALNYIDFNYTEQLKLDTLSEAALVSSSYLSGRFKEEVGMSVVDYINKKKVQRAQTLLVTTNLPVHRISEMVGILDECYFSRTFTRHTGKSPRAYRNSFK